MKEPPVPMGVWKDTYTLQKALRAGGYTTAMIGKWHLPWNAFPPNQELAGQYGFDFTQRRLDRKEFYKESPIFIEEALHFLREKRDPAKPFYLYFAFQTVHGPHKVPEADKERWAKRLEGKNHGWIPDMLPSLEHTDQCIGRVLDALDQLRLTDNTLVVLSSDNGGVSGEKYSVENKPLRQGKGTLYEGGVRVPLAFCWPGHIKPGSRCETPVHFVDLFPTFCDVAGVPTDPTHRLDGVELTPLFSGGSIPPRTIFLHYPHYVAQWGTTPVRAVIRDRYKLVVNPFDHIDIPGRTARTGTYIPEPRVELFDLQADPSERANIAAQHPEIVAEMQRALDAWLKETGARDATPNPDYDPANPLTNLRTMAIKRGETLPTAKTQLTDEKE
jgi:arylsulfatase A-like enzyme